WPKDGAELTSVVDAWIARYGMVFSACAVAELGDLVTWADGRLHISRTDTTPAGKWSSPMVHPFADRMREHLAVATDEEYAAVRQALVSYRGTRAWQRVLTCFLMPTEKVWVDQDCRAIAAVGGGVDAVARLLLNSVISTEQLDLIVDRLTFWLMLESAGPV